jgi:hypothetical protein
MFADWRCLADPFLKETPMLPLAVVNALFQVGSAKQKVL